MKFIYEPLEHDPSGEMIYARFVIIQPGSQSDEIECKLVSCGHTKAQRPAEIKYEALSYMWGLPGGSRSILLNEKRFPITENLWSCLIHLRSPEKEKIMWIDSICINQNDDDEKSIQVAQMSWIYQAAATVAVWLGGDDLSFGSTSMDLIRRLWNKETHSTTFWGSLIQDLENNHGEATQPEWLALQALCKLKYWTRVWIVQEVVLGLRITLHWGMGTMTWDQLFDILDRVTEMDEAPGLMIQPGDWSEATRNSMPFRLCEQKRGGGSLPYRLKSMYELLGSYERSECFDVRDKVFGMKVLTYSEIPVDYSKSALEVCGDVLKDEASWLCKYYRNASSETVWKGVWDMNCLKVVFRGEYIHKILSKDSSPKAAYKSGQQQQILPRPIQATGNISGSIIYITEILSSYAKLSRDEIKLLIGGSIAAVFETLTNDVAQLSPVNARFNARRDVNQLAICDRCEQPILGIRYKCLDCADYDLCHSCIPNAKTTHSNHSFDTIYTQIEDPPKDLSDLRTQLVFLSKMLAQHPESVSQDLKGGTPYRSFAIPETSSSYGVEPPPRTTLAGRGPYLPDSWLKRQEDTQSSWLEERKEAINALSSYAENNHPSPEEIVLDLIKQAIADLPSDTLTETKLFLTSSGIVGFASENIMQGDIICTFTETQTLLIVRKEAAAAKTSSPRFKPVGLASPYIRDIDSPPSFSNGKSVRAGRMDLAHVPDRMIRFYFDLGTLQALCCFGSEWAKFISDDLKGPVGRRRLSPYAYRSSDAKRAGVK